MTINEHNFLNELEEILKKQYNEIQPNITFKELYLQLENTLTNLRTKYDLPENPQYTNTTIILFLSGVQAAAYDKNYLYKRNAYDLFLEKLDSLFESNTSYTAPDDNIYIIERTPKRGIEKLKHEIILEFQLNQKENQQPPILHHTIKIITSRFN